MGLYRLGGFCWRAADCWPHFQLATKDKFKLLTALFDQWWLVTPAPLLEGLQGEGERGLDALQQVLHSRTIVSCETFQLLVIIYSTSKRKLLAAVLGPYPSPRPLLLLYNCLQLL